MTSSVAFWLVLAVLLFWSLGAYNRLVRLRARVLGRFAQVDQHMVQALALLGDAARVPVGPTVANPATRLEATLPAAHDGLQAVAIQFEVALRVARKQALDASAVAALQTAYATVHDVWARRRHGSADPASAEAAALQRAWEGNTEVVRDAAAGFNAAVQAYNAAITQFPASMLAYLFSFSQAAQL